MTEHILKETLFYVNVGFLSLAHVLFDKADREEHSVQTTARH